MAPADGFVADATVDMHQPGQRQKVFVSYSRTNIAIADEICAGLAFDGGFEVFLDRHSIHEGEVWRERLAGLIASADTVVFLLSKASAGSELCRWEVDQAQGLSKRIVPALIEQVDGATVPPALTALQYVRFDNGSFMGGLAGLREALRADIGWVREHTRLLTRAQEWDAAGRIANRLLSGPDIVAAKLWLEQRPQDAPPPLELHRDFIAASEHAETARVGEDRKRAQQLKDALGRSRIALAAAIGGVVVAAGAGAWAYAIGVNAENAAVERDAYIAEREKLILAQQQQIAALAGGAPPVANAPAAGDRPSPPPSEHGSGAPTPAPTSSPTPAPTWSAPHAGPTSQPPPQPPSKSGDVAADDLRELQFQAESLFEQVSKLAAGGSSDKSAPPLPPRGKVTREELESYVAMMSKQREALLYDDQRVQQRIAPPEQYKRNLPSAK